MPAARTKSKPPTKPPAASSDTGEKKVRGRRTRRVTGDEEGRASSVKKQINTGQALAPVAVPIGANGKPMIEILVQSSETVPVAQYANVVIGPVAVRRWVEDTGDDDELRDTINRNQNLVEDIVSEDREIVQESVASYNKAEAEAKKSDAKKS